MPGRLIHVGPITALTPMACRTAKDVLVRFSAADMEILGQVCSASALQGFPGAGVFAAHPPRRQRRRGA